jgi:hypothetical protein
MFHLSIVLLQLPFYLRSPDCQALGPEYPCSPGDEDQCTRGAVCESPSDFCTNPNPGGGCGGLGMLKIVYFCEYKDVLLC